MNYTILETGFDHVTIYKSYSSFVSMKIRKKCTITKKLQQLSIFTHSWYNRVKIKEQDFKIKS